MDTMDRLCALLPEATDALHACGETLCEVRLRVGQPIQLRCLDGQRLIDAAVDGERFRQVLAALMDHSLYAREAELTQGFFTLRDGCRVGVCGRVLHDGERATGMGEIGSACIRLNRAAMGGVEALMKRILPDGTGRIRSTLILSRPGMGKTTCLRGIARSLSVRGWCVAIADERHELAACRDGVPMLDVGPCADVMDGGPKRAAIMRMLRAVAPQVIVADEIGDRGDARAVAEAARCGVAVITSAHADGLAAAMRRPGIAAAIREGVFSLAVVLGSPPGTVREVIDLDGGEDADAVDTGDMRGGGLHALRAIDGGRRPAAGGAAPAPGEWR